MNQKYRFAAIAELLAAVLGFLALAFIFVDVVAFGALKNRESGGDAVGGIFIFIFFSLLFQLPAALIYGICGLIEGKRMLSAAKGKTLSVKSSVLLFVIKTVAIAVCGFVAVVYISSNFIAWGIVLCTTIVLQLAATVYAFILAFRKKSVT
ncbi:MAG: hypothetical protein J6A46_02605 [Clostridia bacterium]|nr:hypothetical protein [Clostridia bacterium]